MLSVVSGIHRRGAVSWNVSPVDKEGLLCPKAYKRSESLYFLILSFHLFIFGCAGLRRCAGFSLVVASRGYSLVAVYSFLTAVAALVEKLLEDGPSGARASAAVAPGLEGTGSIVAAHRLRCSVACAISPDQGSNLYLLHWQAASSPISHKEALSFLIQDMLKILE